jgi:hypothetical protein
MNVFTLDELIKVVTENVFQTLLLTPVVTLIAARVTKTLFKQRSLSDLTGEWLQVIPSQANDNRQYSVGELYFDRRRNEFHFDGVNYLLGDKGCKPYYQWESKYLQSGIEDTPKHVMYMYTVNDREKDIYNMSLSELENWQKNLESKGKVARVIKNFTKKL